MIVWGVAGCGMKLTEEVERSCSPGGCDTYGCHGSGVCEFLCWCSEVVIAR